MIVFPQREQCAYTAYFCEENIWRLGQRFLRMGLNPQDGTVWLMSNAQRQIPLRKQRMGNHGLVLWDYHVVLEWRLCQASWIFDFDSEMPWPCVTSHYVSETFPPPVHLALEGWIKIRRVALPDYLACFHSDRSHMLDKQGQPLCPFPPAPPIHPLPGYPKVDLWDYLDMQQETPGQVDWWFALNSTAPKRNN